MPYWLVQTGEGPGIHGGLHAIDTPSCDEYLAKIESAGGTTVVPKMAVLRERRLHGLEQIGHCLGWSLSCR